MNAKTITSALITVILGVTLAMPTTALAERDGRGHRQGHSQHDGNRHRQNRQHNRESNRHNRGHKEQKRHSKRHYKEDRHRAKRHHKEDRRHAKRHHKENRRHYGKHNDGHYNRHRGHRKYSHGYGRGRDYGNRYGYGGYGSNYYDDDDDDEKLLIGLVVGGILGYALNESQQDDGDFYDNSYTQAETTSYNNGTCLQEREYQTTVLVGGRKVDAYGTACLQPDGSWKRSLPTVPAY